jgi:hypothetical protein
MSGSSVCSTLSVVVIGRNEGQRLRHCLASVNAMERGPWALETIYVDSGSTDGSVALAQGLGAKTIALTPEHPTAALGRNAGWRAAVGEIILFLDGDTVLAPDFVLTSLPEFADTRIACVWGHRREVHPERSLYNRVLDLDWIYAPGITPFCGGDALFRRDVLAQTGGFDETLIAGEEPELCRRIIAAGSRILHVDRPMTGHDLAMTQFSQYWRRCTRAGHAYAEIAQRFGDSAQPFWSEEVKRNRQRATLLCAIALVGVTVSLRTRSAIPLSLAVALFAALAARSAWKARWKSTSVGTLLLYGVHSHFQQIPILVGQLRFRIQRRRGQRATLVEYKLP